MFLEVFDNVDLNLGDKVDEDSLVFQQDLTDKVKSISFIDTDLESLTDDGVIKNFKNL